MIKSIKNNPLSRLTEVQPDIPKIEHTPKKKTAKPGRPKRKDLVRDNAAQNGLPEDYTRKTFIVNVDILKKLEGYAYTERLSIKDALNSLLEESLKDKKIIYKK